MPIERSTQCTRWAIVCSHIKLIYSLFAIKLTEYVHFSRSRTSATTHCRLYRHQKPSASIFVRTKKKISHNVMRINAQTHTHRNFACRHLHACITHFMYDPLSTFIVESFIRGAVTVATSKHGPCAHRCFFRARLLLFRTSSHQQSASHTHGAC